jgi:Thermopsin
VDIPKPKQRVKVIGGSVFCFSCKEISAFYCICGSFTIQMLVGKITSGAHAGSSGVEFQFSVFHGATKVGSVIFDLVAFNGNAPNFPFYFVDDVFTPIGNPLLYDAETVLCGPGGGSSIAITKISAQFTMQYQSVAGAKFKTITHAFTEGRDTAESASGVRMTFTRKTGITSSGSDNSGQLW